MNFSMTIENASVSTVVRNEYEIVRHIEACFLAAGYDSDTFAEYLAHYLELYHEMTVLPEKDYAQALDEARNEAYDEGYDDAELEGKEIGNSEGYDRGYRDGLDDGKRSMVEDEEESDEEESIEMECQCPMCQDPTAYDAGWNDGYQGEENIDEDMAKVPAYMVGYENGKNDRQKSGS